ncbi:MAG: hypothetical protein JNM38_25365, partial [Acidobacteria bacterium]|nr:hypothetical protein [Acidobacteriota bacterium]
WYITDYAKKSGANASSANKSADAAGEKSSDSKPAESTTPAPAAKSDAKS